MSQSVDAMEKPMAIVAQPNALELLNLPWVNVRSAIYQIDPQ